MTSFRLEPFLWIHLSGLGLLPLLFQGVWLGLAVGDPLPMLGLEPLLVGTLGILPILWMQWHRPFDIFSLVLFAVRTEALTAQQRQILALFKTGKQRAIALVGALVMFVLFWQVYRFAPLASPAAAFFTPGASLGIAGGAIAFLGCNLFWQVPLSVLGVLATGKQQWEATEAYPVEQIEREFTVPGLRVRRLLPTLVSEPTEREREG
ncbi:MAG: low-complexity tail membrane protein [Chloroflexaceae bacterium]|nr:low-complexity tail membrane protein [Chloroflexaceae bacterium]